MAAVSVHPTVQPAFCSGVSFPPFGLVPSISPRQKVYEWRYGTQRPVNSVSHASLHTPALADEMTESRIQSVIPGHRCRPRRAIRFA
jgi:hypothetical protein